MMELLGGEMGERRGRPDLGVGGAAMALEGRSAGPPVLRCQRVCHYRPGSQHLSQPLKESESETLGEPSLASGDGSRRRLSFASASHAGVIYMCVVMLLR